MSIGEKYIGGITLIEKIHYYLCYASENYFTIKDLEIFRRQSNILYYTSRISRKISSTIKYWTSELRNIIYFTSYILYIKYFLDVNLNHIASLAIEFDIIFPKPLVFYEMKCLMRLQVDFTFLYTHPKNFLR